MPKTAIIIGAGPAGLTAAYELLQKTDIKPVIYEASGDIGGISKTVNFKGNRFDLGGHRFFSKSEEIMKWWTDIFPVQGSPSIDDYFLGRKIPLSLKPGAPDPEKTDSCMLVRKRVSRIFFLRRFFDYPISIKAKTFLNLGLGRTFVIILSYIWARIFPIKKERSLEDFFINRFGKALYETFFKDYTKKVWGISCRDISPEWGSQRVKGLSVLAAVRHALTRKFSPLKEDIAQKATETSLIENYLYPKYGPGQIWERVAELIRQKGGEIHFYHKIIGLKAENDQVISVEIKDKKENKHITVGGDYFFSTMPVRDLVGNFHNSVPEEAGSAALGLIYRDFISVGLILNKLKIKNDTKEKTINNITPDNWLYIQEKDVKLGRVQILNNWSPYLLKDMSKVSLGLEYFCNEGDELWGMTDSKLIDFGLDELARLGFADKKDLIDGTVMRMPKAYPAYFGTYDKFGDIRKFTDRFTNLFLIGRNGMHRYNNMDHSMMTAMVAVENILTGNHSKDNIWSVNTEDEYHENK